MSYKVKNPRGKQWSINQWLYMFQLYETDIVKFKYEFVKFKRTNFSRNAKSMFLKKYKKYIYNNRSVEVLMSKTGKSSKGKTGRPKGSMNRDALIKELFEKLPDDILQEILKKGIDKIKEENKETNNEIIKKIIDMKILSYRKIAAIFNISKTTIGRIANGFIYKKKKDNKAEKATIELFIRYKGKLGREPLSQYVYQAIGIEKSSRQIGRYLSKNSLQCVIRVKARKVREDKNTSVSIPDLVNRDYDNQLHEETILATDVTYIDSPLDVDQNHVYLSAVFNHKTKTIESFVLSKNNDKNLVINTIKDIEINNVILHSDHGSVYSSEEFMSVVKSKNWKQSMSRVGNSLDNREIEFWFSILKTELIYQINVKKITLEELSSLINEWINYYNYHRIQKKLNWSSPCSI